MRRHGWALYLGMLAGAPAVAQPPADSERHPPPPELPGVVVSQTQGSRPVVVAAPVAQTRTSLKPAEAGPLPTAESEPKEPVATTTVAPTSLPPGAPAGDTLPGPATLPAAGCATPACGAGHGSIREWLTFKSKARQSGHYIPRYVPPLQAWFPCDPKQSSYGPRVLPQVGCGVPGATAIGPAPAAPDVPPAGAPPAAAQLGCPDKEALTSFEKVGDGLGFVAGAAPMASPTTQVKQSTWRPR